MAQRNGLEIQESAIIANSKRIAESLARIILDNSTLDILAILPNSIKIIILTTKRVLNSYFNQFSYHDTFRQP